MTAIVDTHTKGGDPLGAPFMGSAGLVEASPKGGLARHLRMIDSILDYETENMRWLRENGPAIHQACAEMDAENASNISQENDR